MNSAWLWTLLALPVLGALSLVAIPREEESSVRGATLFWSLATFFASLPLFFIYDWGASGSAVFQFTSDHAWLAPLGASLKVGIDGISLLLILLTTFLVPICVLASWRSIDERVKEFHAALLLLEAAMIGVFCARDLLLFYLFWEAMLLPMFLIIGVWGGRKRVAAAMKFFVYTAVGSLLMLAAVLYVYAAAGRTFDLDQIQTNLAALRASGQLSENAQLWLFAAFGIAFAIKVPLFPFHTWLPHAHVEAPAAGSVILAAVLLKMGGYGFVRLAIPLFPAGAQLAAPFVLALAAVGVVYGSLMALSQSDVKRLIAYSSVSHLALVVLGIFVFTTRGITGGMFQMLAHGLSTGALFLLVGCLYERRHTREVADLGGIAASAPRLAACFVIATLASIALPFTCGFVGEFLILLGVFEAKHPYLAAAAASGAVLGAGYMLLVVRGIFFGEAKGANAHTPDLQGRELAFLIPVLALAVLLGVTPRPFLERLEPSVQHVLDEARIGKEG
jgi:NADH-quinone oxidoreductase subunit M